MAWGGAESAHQMLQSSPQDTFLKKKVKGVFINV